MAIEDFVVQITNEAVLLTIVISLPAVVVSLIVGLAVAIFSATTQIQEQTLSFVPKIIAVFGILAATAVWMGSVMVRFAAKCLGAFYEVVP